MGSSEPAPLRATCSIGASPQSGCPEFSATLAEAHLNPVGEDKIQISLERRMTEARQSNSLQIEVRQTFLCEGSSRVISAPGGRIVSAALSVGLEP